jgi:diguanylate cyclase (GGDEF)-like protein
MISVLSIITSYINKVYIGQLKENSIKDHLTLLFNRRYFDEILDYWIQKAQSKKNTFGVILIDVDNFKSYNDTHGHHSGDKLLQYISTFLASNVGFHDVVCRYGGDEFAIIITESTHEFVYEIASSIVSSINEIDFSTQGFGFNHVTLSMGLAFFPAHGLNRKDLMEHADKNLMKAKESGKNQVVF